MNDQQMSEMMAKMDEILREIQMLKVELKVIKENSRPRTGLEEYL